MIDLFKRRNDEDFEEMQAPENGSDASGKIGFLGRFTRHKEENEESEDDTTEIVKESSPDRKPRSFFLLNWFKRHEQEEIEETTRLVRYAAELHGVATRDVADAVTDEDEDEDDATDERTRRTSKHMGVWVTMVVVGIMFGVGIIFLMRFTNGSDMTGPGAQAAIQAVQKSIQPTPGANPTYSGTYISFTYPSTFNNVKIQPPTGIWAEQFTINSTVNFDREIAVAVENNVTAQTDSGYMYRNMTPSLYTSEKTTVMKEPAVVMVKADNTEHTLYWAHGGKLVIVSITDTNAGEDISAYMTLVTSTLRWI